MSVSKSTTEGSSTLEYPPELKKSIDDLLLVLTTVLNHDVTERKTKKCPAATQLTYLNKYIRLCKLLELPEYAEDFQRLFKKHRLGIMNGYKSDKWLTTGAINIISNEDGEAFNPDIKIPLTLIYNIACTMRDRTKKIFEGLPDDDMADKPEMFYPDQINYHLYTIFSLLNPKTKTLKDIAKFFQEALPGEEPVETPSNNTPATNPSTESKNPLPGLGDAGLGGLISTVFTSPELQSCMSRMATDLKDCSSIEQAGQALSKIMGDGQLTGLLGRVVSNMPGAPTMPTAPTVVSPTAVQPGPPTNLSNSTEMSSANPNLSSSTPVMMPYPQGSYPPGPLPYPPGAYPQGLPPYYPYHYPYPPGPYPSGPMMSPPVSTAPSTNASVVTGTATIIATSTITTPGIETTTSGVIVTPPPPAPKAASATIEVVEEPKTTVLPTDTVVAK